MPVGEKECRTPSAFLPTGLRLNAKTGSLVLPAGLGKREAILLSTAEGELNSFKKGCLTVSTFKPDRFISISNRLDPAAAPGDVVVVAMFLKEMIVAVEAFKPNDVATALVYRVCVILSNVLEVWPPCTVNAMLIV